MNIITCEHCQNMETLEYTIIDPKTNEQVHINLCECQKRIDMFGNCFTVDPTALRQCSLRKE